MQMVSRHGQEEFEYSFALFRQQSYWALVFNEELNTSACFCCCCCFVVYVCLIWFDFLDFENTSFTQGLLLVL